MPACTHSGAVAFQIKIGSVSSHCGVGIMSFQIACICTGSTTEMLHLFRRMSADIIAKLMANEPAVPKARLFVNA